MAYASLLRPQQRHSHIPELSCGFNSKDFSNSAKNINFVRVVIEARTSTAVK